VKRYLRRQAEESKKKNAPLGQFSSIHMSSKGKFHARSTPKGTVGRLELPFGTNPCSDHAMISGQNRFFSLLSSQESPFAYLPGSFVRLGNVRMTIRRFRNEKGATLADRAFWI
jgi:hypothetical protein